ncbi:MAG: dethiobiotin synthase [Candidatus Caenarcaniphilales bacterium]|jgi:dethiobiotin synthetase|nr:dethiobiotin synthase [Candidatus Caenarcaniphilales bacterium]
MQAVFISATDTGVGKTFFSIELIKYLIESKSFKPNEIAYYKPVQTGGSGHCEEQTQSATWQSHNEEFVFDTIAVAKANLGIDIFNSYSFEFPASPDYSSKLELSCHSETSEAQSKNLINISKIIDDYNALKAKYKFIVVEGAGGLAVPLNEKDLLVDVIKALGLDLILVTRASLGTINHTLLSIAYAKNHGINVLGIVPRKPESAAEEAAIESILRFSGVSKLEISDISVIAS